jgi:uncharacterized membrane protein
MVTGTMEVWLKTWTYKLAFGIEASAAVMIGVAVIISVYQVFSVFFRNVDGVEERDNVRIRLGRWLALALEFEIAADILRTTITPTWNQIGQLAAVVILRTVLNHFLQKDIEKAALHKT